LFSLYHKTDQPYFHLHGIATGPVWISLPFQLAITRPRRLDGEVTTKTPCVRTLPDVASVDSVTDEVDGVVGGQGDVGQAADEPRRVLVQRAEHDVVHSACNIRALAH